MRVITITNHKGGVGKTTTAVTLGHGLAKTGKRVIIIDLDAQGHVASSLNIECQQASHLLFNLPDRSSATLEWLKRYFFPARDNLWILPGGSQLEGVQASLGTGHRPTNELRDILGMLTNLFDYVVIDTAPSRGGIQERALFAADFVIIPSSPRYLSIQGARDTMMILDKLEKGGWGGKLIGILPTFFGTNAVDARNNMEDLVGNLGKIVMEPIHNAEAITRASTNGMTVFEWDSNSRSASEYQNLVNRVLWLK
jgi:chromosome partitioning protein